MTGNREPIFTQFPPVNRWGDFQGYSSFGITVDRKHTLKWLFPQARATLLAPHQGHTNSETALSFVSMIHAAEVMRWSGSARDMG
jgi:hypothetical protein